MKRMACAVALATGTGVVLGGAAQKAAADAVPIAATSGLQISIVPPGSITSDMAATLDISFRGGSVRTIELSVDNNRIYKKTVKFDATVSSFNLKIDNSVLPEGDHEVTLVATDFDGTTATSSVRIHVLGPQADGIAEFAYPRRNAMVQNVVPIELKLDANIRMPYVSFLVDNDSQSIRNYAPYVYNWDSAKVADGPHTIGVEVYDSSTHELLKKLTIPVIVKNVGGFTNIQPTTPTISSTTRSSGVRSIIGEAISAPFEKIAEEGAALTHSNGTAINGYKLRSTEPHSTALFNAIAPERNTKNIEPDGPISFTAVPHSSSIAGFTMMATLPALVAEPETAPSTALANTDGRIARLAIQPTRSGNVAVKPRATLDRPLKPIVIAQYVVPPVAAVNSRWIRGEKSIQVAFNSSMIAFDVKPRVTHGTPLTPFRAIFEHAGGTVQWFGKSHVVRAVSADRVIEFRIGEQTARVNGRTVKLAYRPYVENGRAIVPLSFVRDAMNVNVTYDASHSQISIRSKHS